MEENYIEISNPGNNLSESHFKDFFGYVVKDNKGKELDGEYQFGEYPFAIIRFHNGLIDGNIYDQYGDIIERYPALIYQSNYTACTEYWTKGFPDGNPAIDFGKYTECWKDKQLISIRKAHNWDEESEQFTHKFLFEEKGESLIKSIVYVEVDDYENFGYEIEDEDNYYDYNFDDYNKKWCNPPSVINEEKEIDKILSFDNYLTFKDRLFQIMKIRNLTAPKLYKKINMSQQTFNNVINSKALVSYNNALVLALGLELTFEQMIKFVNFARKGFGHDPQQDKFVREAIENKDYSIYNLNRKIEKVNEKIRKINKEYFELFGKNKKNEIKLFLLQKEENQTQTTKTKTSSKKKDDKKSSNEKNTIKQK